MIERFLIAWPDAPGEWREETPRRPDDTWTAALRRAIGRSVDACRAAGAELFVNDHWKLAAEFGAGGVHLGQEDLLALGDEGGADLVATGLALGVSSHMSGSCAGRAASGHVTSPAVRSGRR